MTRAITQPAYPKQRARALTRDAADFLDAVDTSRKEQPDYPRLSAKVSPLGLGLSVSLSSLSAFGELSK